MINFPNFFFYYQPKENREKYTFSFGDNGFHYTLMYIAHKKAFDFHKKNDNIKGTENENPYEPFFEMSSFKFFRFLQKNTIVQEFLIKEFVFKNKINIGKLKRYNCWLMKLEDINLSEEIYKKERKGRIFKLNKKFDLNKMINELEFLHPDEISIVNCNLFSVFRHRKGVISFQGYIYKINNQLYFWSKKNVNLYARLLIVVCYNHLSQISFINKDKLLKMLYEVITNKYKSLNN